MVKALVKDVNGNLCIGQSFVFYCADGNKHEGKTNEEGYAIAILTITPENVGDYVITATVVDSQAEGIINITKSSSECVAEGTLITLADGTQKAVEELTGDELLLVWNLHTGTFDVAPILFIDSDPAKEYKVVNLYFSDGTTVKVIHEHGFWNLDLNRYIFLRDDADKYIGHWFNKQITDTNGKLAWTKVQLINTVVQVEHTTAWSPVTFEHLCYYVNGMLSMPGATIGLINIFEVNNETMMFDQEAMQADILNYGLFTYEEFAEMFSIPEEIFEAFGGQYLKVSIGKGLIDYESLGELIAIYFEFFNIQTGGLV